MPIFWNSSIFSALGIFLVLQSIFNRTQKRPKNSYKNLILAPQVFLTLDYLTNPTQLQNAGADVHRQVLDRRGTHS